MLSGVGIRGADVVAEVGRTRGGGVTFSVCKHLSRHISGFWHVGGGPVHTIFSQISEFPIASRLVYLISFPVICNPSLLAACCFLSPGHAFKASAPCIPTCEVLVGRGIFINSSDLDSAVLSNIPRAVIAI
jgi:hypothetical protein